MGDVAEPTHFIDVAADLPPVLNSLWVDARASDPDRAEFDLIWSRPFERHELPIAHVALLWTDEYGTTLEWQRTGFSDDQREWRVPQIPASWDGPFRPSAYPPEDIFGAISWMRTDDILDWAMAKRDLGAGLVVPQSINILGSTAPDIEALGQIDLINFAGADY